MADLPSSSDTVVATSGVSKRSPLDGADSPAVPQVVPDVIEKVIRVLREPGVALGMSVAGGTGALPPDTRDQVPYVLVLTSFFLSADGNKFCFYANKL